MVEKRGVVAVVLTDIQKYLTYPVLHIRRSLEGKWGRMVKKDFLQCGATDTIIQRTKNDRKRPCFAFFPSSSQKKSSMNFKEVINNNIILKCTLNKNSFISTHSYIMWHWVCQGDCIRWRLWANQQFTCWLWANQWPWRRLWANQEFTCWLWANKWQGRRLRAPRVHMLTLSQWIIMMKALSR